MNGHNFLRIVNEAFVPFLKELGFLKDAQSISWRFYRVSFTGSGHAVLVSFEPAEEALFVMVPSKQGSELSEIDDRIKTPRLSELNARYAFTITSEERVINEALFSTIVARDNEEKLLLKAAKELRLVLPRYVK